MYVLFRISCHQRNSRAGTQREKISVAISVALAAAAGGINIKRSVA